LFLKGIEMTKIGLFYGSTTGNTEDAAKRIKAALGNGVVKMLDIAQVQAQTMDEFDVMILGTSTWGNGEQQDDWDNYESELAKVDWSNKLVALFGLGDQYTYSDTFVDAMGMLYETIVDKGGKVIGAWAGENYEFDTSLAHRDGKFVGLALDADNQPELTDERIEQWVNQIKGEFGL
jgi:flavodoxin I